jgi:SAM-dependent methyltransferase
MWGSYQLAATQHGESGWHEYAVYGAMCVVGLAMVSAERTQAVGDFVVKLIRDIRESLKDEKTEDEGVPKQGVLNEDAPPPDPDEWYRLLRPVLYQASHYSVPTYYLNLNLTVIDWNVAFELVFRHILGKIRNKHVNMFINQLENKSDVFDRAREFTEKVRRGLLPLVHMEELIYRADRYGLVNFLKVATQLNDVKGDQIGWTVALMIRQIEWGPFERDLYDKVREDKLWSVYAPSYDRILLKFPPYLKLIEDVISVIPDDSRAVIDLGAGTGNVTSALLKRGHRVMAIENNLPMLEKLRDQRFDPANLIIVKASANVLDSLDPKLRGTFDAVVAVNVLYAVDDPLTCLQTVYKLLKPGGVVGLSTTHSETRLDPLLDSIKNKLKAIGKYEALADDYERLRQANKDIERTIALRHSRDDYRKWVKTAGFKIIKEVPSSYEDAVMIIHAAKPDEPSSVP